MALRRRSTPHSTAAPPEDECSPGRADIAEASNLTRRACRTAQNAKPYHSWLPMLALRRWRDHQLDEGTTDPHIAPPEPCERCCRKAGRGVQCDRGPVTLLGERRRHCRLDEERHQFDVQGVCQLRACPERPLAEHPPDEAPDVC